jgi:hypothetical protein
LPWWNLQYLSIESGNRHFGLSGPFLMDLRRFSIVGHVGRAVDLQIGNSVEELGDSCFSTQVSLSTVTFEPNCRLRRIAVWALRMCQMLKSIAVPACVETLDCHCFFGCQSLSVVTFESESMCAVIGEHAFSNCPALAAISLPPSLERLGPRAFERCISLAMVAIRSGSNLCFIGQFPFQDCELLKSIQIPASDMAICRQSLGSEGPFLCKLGDASHSGWLSRIRIGRAVKAIEYAVVEEE